MTVRKYTGEGAVKGKEFATDARSDVAVPMGTIGARLTDAEIGEIFADEVRREGFTVKRVTCFAGEAEVETGVIREPQRVLDAIRRADLRLNVLAPRAAFDAWNRAATPTWWQRFRAWLRGAP